MLTHSHHLHRAWRIIPALITYQLAKLASLVSACACLLTSFSMDGLICFHCCLQNVRVEIEGRKRGHFWTFNIVRDDDRVGVPISLVRCSTESHNVFEKWLTVSVCVTNSSCMSSTQDTLTCRMYHLGLAYQQADG